MKDITIELIDDLAVLFVNAFNKEPWNDNWTIEQAKERLIDIINTPKFCGMASYEDKKLVGFIMGKGEQYYDGIHFQILEFCVDNKMQGKGLGRKILKEFIKTLESKGIYKIFLLTLRNEHTEGFYRKNGLVTDENMCLMYKE